jgi:hypothetical protein
VKGVLICTMSPRNVTPSNLAFFRGNDTISMIRLRGKWLERVGFDEAEFPLARALPSFRLKTEVSLHMDDWAYYCFKVVILRMTSRLIVISMASHGPR